MGNEQSQILEVLQMAIQMEIDGKAFYQKVSRESQHEMGKRLYATLAEEEDLHRMKFQEIYENMRKQEAWPSVEFHPNKGKNIQTVFSQAIKEGLKPTTSELEAVQKAIEMEAKTYDLYKRQVNTGSSKPQKEFFEALAGEERGHQLALVDYQEYLNNPAGYFVMKERHSLDGG